MNKRIGVIGAGQLAQMLAESAEPLEICVCAFTPDLQVSARYDAELTQGDLSDTAAFKAWAATLDVLTFEFENVDVSLLEASLKNSTLLVAPNLGALKIAQDRHLEKNFFRSQNIPTTTFKVVDTRQTAQTAALEIGLPVIIKTCREGYDGKGQVLIRTTEDFAKLDEHFDDRVLMIEKLVNFDREVSIIAVRSTQGEMAFYPLTENEHQGGILRLSKAPYDDSALQQLAEQHATKVLKALDYVGVLAIEFFQVGDLLIANEMAPRVHNSGHWTIEGAVTSQFENHIRSVSGLPLGRTAPRGYSAMINLIGTMPASLEPILTIPNVHFHTYHKIAQPNRKLGHITVCADNREACDAIVEKILKAT